LLLIRMASTSSGLRDLLPVVEGTEPRHCVIDVFKTTVA
jgi:hypothetical protein